MKKSLALFDFDGTLTTKDSLADFIVYSFGLPKTIVGAFFLSPYLIGYSIKAIPNDQAKAYVTRHFFGGLMLSELNTLGEQYAYKRIPLILRPEGLKRLQWHQQCHHDIVIVSASPDIWLKPWTDKMGFKLISTKLARDGQIIKGHFHGKNCHGNEKVKRISQEFDLSSYDDIYAYGDTSGDKPMLALANYAFYKPFR